MSDCNESLLLRIWPQNRMGIFERIKALLASGGVQVNKLDQAALRQPASRRLPTSTTITPFNAGDVVVTDEYRAVLQAIDARAPIVFVSGKAGTGKSTLIQWLVTQRKRQTAIVAPTGIAALNVGGATIHSFFRLPPRLIEPGDIRAVTQRAIYKHLELLIVDEVSMVRADLMDGIGWFLEKNGPRPGEPFGGVQVLLVGDLFQLPPVVDQQDLNTFFRRVYRSPYFFSAKVLREASIIPVELGRVFRQRDPSFADLLNKIREGQDVEETVAAINARCGGKNRPAREGPSVTLTPTNRVADVRNSKALEILPGRSELYPGKFKGDFDSKAERLPAPQNLELKPGAQVMFTKNDSTKRWVNGTLGIVREVRQGMVRVELAFSPSRAVVDVLPATWDSFKYRWDEATESIDKKATGQYIQIPLMLAWATTIHKSQGKTLDAIEIDLEGGSFASGQTYVALSRCREIDNIKLTRPIRPADVICDAEIARFYRELRRLADGTESDS